MRLAPRSTLFPYTTLFRSLTCRAVRRFTEALASVDQVLALESANTDALGLKAGVFRATGDLQAVEPLLANPGISPLDRSVQADRKSTRLNSSHRTISYAVF